MSTDPEVCPVPTGCLARERDGLHVVGGAQRALGAAPRPKVDPRGHADHPANSERQARGPHLGSQALPNALPLKV